MLNALPLPVLTIGSDERIVHCSHAAESFFDSSARLMQRRQLRDIIPFASPIIALVAEVRRRRSSVSEYRVELVSPRSGQERSVDVFGTALGDNVRRRLRVRRRDNRLRRSWVSENLLFTAKSTLTSTDASITRKPWNPLTFKSGSTTPHCAPLGDMPAVPTM